MNTYQAKIIGELIGIARATDGNEHLISDRSTALIREALSAPLSSEEELNGFLTRAGEVKREMVPDCFLCANPCGRTSAFDLAELEALPIEERTIKQRILEGLLRSTAETSDESLYRGLIALGMEGISLGTLETIAMEL